MGNALRQDQRGVGSTAHQGPLDHQEPDPFSKTAAAPENGGRKAEEHRNEPNRELHVSEVWPGTVMGVSRGEDSRDGRRDFTAIDVDQIHCRDGSGRAHLRDGRGRTSSGNFWATSSSRRCPSRNSSAPSMLPFLPEIKKISDGMQYRDFITVGLLASKLRVHEKCGAQLTDQRQLDLHSGARRDTLADFRYLITGARRW